MYLEFHCFKMYVHIYRFELNVYTCSTKTREYEIHQRKYSFWLQKVVKNNLNIIYKNFRGGTYKLFHEFISAIAFIDKEDSHWMDHFFVRLSREITKKSENTVLSYKNASKVFKNIIFENFGG